MTLKKYYYLLRVFIFIDINYSKISIVDKVHRLEAMLHLPVPQDLI